MPPNKALCPSTFQCSRVHQAQDPHQRHIRNPHPRQPPGPGIPWTPHPLWVCQSRVSDSPSHPTLGPLISGDLPASSPHCRQSLDLSSWLVPRLCTPIPTSAVFLQTSQTTTPPIPGSSCSRRPNTSNITGILHSSQPLNSSSKPVPRSPKPANPRIPQLVSAWVFQPRQSQDLPSPKALGLPIATSLRIKALFIPSVLIFCSPLEMLSFIQSIISTQ